MIPTFPFLHRDSSASARVEHPDLDLDIRFFASPDVPVSEDAFRQLFDFADLARAAHDLHAMTRTSGARFFGDESAGIARIVLTPDFHKGSGIPVGTVVDARHMVVPKAIGNDVCCGMRLLATDLPADAIGPFMPELTRRLRAIFFEGKRDIPLSPRQREAILRDGLPGLYDVREDNAGVGVWRHYDPDEQRASLDDAHLGGHLHARGLFGFDSFVRSSGRIDGRDPQIGCVGGGNHFVELQRVERLYDGHAARAYGLSRGNLAIMVHSGSVGVGHAVGGHFMDRAREIFPTAVRAPKGGFFPLPTSGPLAHEGASYLDGMANAANFAFANRLFLGLMALRAIREVTGRGVDAKLVYDAPHNLIFPGGERFLHRKGATPAEGPKSSGWLGKPVLVPGSMGAASYVLSGLGNEAALESACHGAGRVLSRGRAAHAGDEAQAEIDALHVVTPIDPRSRALRNRRDILAKHRARLLEESPRAYKGIEPVVSSVEDARIASRTARLWPLCTVKG